MRSYSLESLQQASQYKSWRDVAAHAATLSRRTKPRATRFFSGSFWRQHASALVRQSVASRPRSRALLCSVERLVGCAPAARYSRMSYFPFFRSPGTYARSTRPRRSIHFVLRRATWFSPASEVRALANALMDPALLSFFIPFVLCQHY
jgi:hypothetical protein